MRERQRKGYETGSLRTNHDRVFLTSATIYAARIISYSEFTQACAAQVTNA